MTSACYDDRGLSPVSTTMCGMSRILSGVLFFTRSGFTYRVLLGQNLVIGSVFYIPPAYEVTGVTLV